MAKKKKVRVALRKNRQKRTRANDLTRQFRGDEPGAGIGPVERSRPAPRRALAPPDDHRGGGRGGDPRGVRLGARRRGLARLRRLGMRQGPGGPRARAGPPGPGRRRPDLSLPRPRPPQELRDRGAEYRHGGRPRLVPAGRPFRRRGAGRTDRDPSRRDHPRLSQPAAGHRRQRRPGAHRLGPGRARPQARPGGPLHRLGRDRRRPTRGRLQQGRPRRYGRLTSGSSGSTPSSATRPS